MERFKPTDIGVIPEDWDVTTLGEVAEPDPEALSTKTPPIFRFNYVALEDVSRGKLVGSSEQVFSTAPVRARRVIRVGDILVGTVRPNLQSHLLFRGAAGNWVCSTGFCVLRPKPKRANSKYLFAHLFSSAITRQIEATIAGSSYPAITQRDIRGLAIPIPPTIEEQEAIANALFDADTLIEALELQIAKKRDIQQAATKQLLTGKTRLPRFTGAWKEATLGELVTFLSGGTPLRSNADFWKGDIPWISATSLRCLEIWRSESNVTKEAVQAGSKMAPVGSSLLLVRGSALHKEILCGLVMRPVCFNQDVKALVPSSQVFPKFLTLLVRGSAENLLKLVSSAGNTAGVLDTGLLKSFPLALPEMEEQIAITTVLTDMEMELRALEQKLTKSKAIREGMMQQLLFGKVRLV